MAQFKVDRDILGFKSTRPSPFYQSAGEHKVKCGVCERGCTIPRGGIGVCRNRANIDGKLYVIGYGLLSAVESRPIEVKPFYHYYPGSSALTFSNWGCNFYCPWCQNFTLSFQSPDPERDTYYEPEWVVSLAVKAGDEGVCASFNEPTTQAEYLLDVFSKAESAGLYSCMVTNGYFTLRVLEELVESGLTGLSIDIKGCPQSYSRYMPGIDPEVVFRNARRALDLGVHVEMVYLLVTGANDWQECIEWVIGRHLDFLGDDVPLHINRYYPAHRYSEPPTRLETLLEAYEYARREGVKYVYVGNVGLPKYETTYCPRCGKTLIRRHGYEILEWRLEGDMRCPRCGEKILLFGRPVSKIGRWRGYL